MFTKKLTALLAASAMMAASPAVAQLSQAPQPAAESVGGSAQFDEWGPEIYVLFAVGAALLIWGFIEIIGDDDEEAVSP